MSDTIHSSDFYNKIFNDYRSDNYFEEIVVRINYVKSISQSPVGRLYKIQSLTVEGNGSTEKFQEIQETIDEYNKRLRQEEGDPREWQIFYLYKELFQCFISKYKFNYFRGQSGNYNLVPGILRQDVHNTYRSGFESLYLKISNEFPEKISYFPIESRDSIEKREYQLSLLQHYGLKTSLLDITSNPYIALLFMLSGKIDEYREPTLFLFKLDESLHRQKHLFTEVRKSNLNERIIAQKGAFLNFDKLFDIKSFDINKVFLIKIVLHFDDGCFIEQIDSDINFSKDTRDLEDIDRSEIEEYIKLLEKEKSDLDISKVESLRSISEEFTQKLREYYYFEEDLFPDFEKRIQYLSKKYESSSQKKVTKQQ